MDEAISLEKGVKSKKSYRRNETKKEAKADYLLLQDFPSVCFL